MNEKRPKLNKNGFKGKITNEMLIDEYFKAKEFLWQHYQANPDEREFTIERLQELNPLIEHKKAKEEGYKHPEEHLETFHKVKELIGIKLNDTSFTSRTLRKLVEFLAEDQGWIKCKMNNVPIYEWIYKHYQKIKDLDPDYLKSVGRRILEK